MPGAIIAIDQDRPGGSTSFGTPGVARNDLWVSRTIRPRSTQSGNLSQQWTLLDAPAGSTAVLNNDTATTCDFTPDLPGTYRIQLVTNGGGTGNIQILVARVRYDTNGSITNRGWALPAYGELPPEANYNSNARGWDEPWDFILADLLNVIQNFSPTLSGDVTGSTSATTVAALKGTPLDTSMTAPPDGQIIQKVAGKWAAVSPTSLNSSTRYFNGMPPFTTNLTNFVVASVIEFDPTQIPATTSVRLKLVVETTGPQITAQLYNVTAAAVVPGSTLTSLSTSPVELVTGDLTSALGAGDAIYQVQVKMAGGGGPSDMVSLDLARLECTFTSAPFVPTDIPGCTVWLRADLGFAPSFWADQSGNANNATQATGTRQPSTRTGINGRTTVFWDASVAGSEKFMNLPTLAALTASHAFVVNKRNAAVPGSVSKTGFWRLGTSGQGSNIPYLDGNIYDDGGSTVRANAGAPVVAMSTANVYEVQNQAGAFAILMNGSAQYSAGANTVGLNTSPEIGGADNFGDFYDGDWGEVIIYDHVLAPSDRAKVIAYLNSLWALGAV